MSDLEIELAEALRDYARFVHGEITIFHAQVQVRKNEWFNRLEPTYRLDSVTSILTQNKQPAPTICYSKN